MISLNVIANNFVGVQFLRYECKQCHNNMQFWICYTLKVSFLIWVFGFSHHRLCHFFWKMRVKRHGGNLGAEAWRVQWGKQYQVYIKQPCFVNITCLHNFPMFLATFCSSWSVVEINVLVHGWQLFQRKLQTACCPFCLYCRRQFWTKTTKKCEA